MKSFMLFVSLFLVFALENTALAKCIVVRSDGTIQIWLNRDCRNLPLEGHQVRSCTNAMVSPGGGTGTTTGTKDEMITAIAVMEGKNTVLYDSKGTKLETIAGKLEGAKYATAAPKMESLEK